METALDTHEEQETTPKQPNKWIIFARNISAALFSLTWNFILILAVAGLAFLLTGNYIVPIITALTTFTACTLYLFHYSNYREEFLQIWRHFLGWLALAIVTQIATLSLHDLERTGGPILWSIVASVGIIALASLYFEVSDSDDSFLKNITRFHIFKKILFVTIIFCFASLVYTEWATQWVWVPLALYSLFAFTFDNRKLEFDSDLIIGSVVVSILLGIISSICQYFYADLFTALGFDVQLGHILAVATGVSVCAFAIWKWFKHTKTKAAAIEKAKIEEQQRITAAETQEKEEAERSKQREQIRTQCTKLKSDLDKAENPSWRDILKLGDLIASNHLLPADFHTTWEVCSKASLLVLFETSDIKKQISWKKSELKCALVYLNTIAEDSLNDSLLEAVAKRIQELKKLSVYTNGYATLVEQVREFEEFKKYIEETTVEQ